MKKILFLSLWILLIFSCKFNKNNFKFDLLYATTDWSWNIEYENGIFYENPYSYDYFNNKEQIKTAKITETYTYIDPDDGRMFPTGNHIEFKFNELGQIESEYSAISELDTVQYKYDKEHRLVSYTDGYNSITWVYGSDTERQRFFNGELDQTEKIVFKKDGYTIIVQYSNDKITTINYNYKFGKLVNIENRSNMSSNPDIYTTWSWDFVYKNNLMDSITCKIKFKDNDEFKIRNEYFFEYDANGNLTKERIQRYNIDGLKKGSESAWEYSEYDSYGNWEVKKYSNSDRIVKRSIEYK